MHNFLTVSGPNTLYALGVFGVVGAFIVSAHGVDGSRESRSGGGEPAEWVLSSEPTLVLGGMDGEGPEEFGSIVGAAWMADGSILTADALIDQIQRFAPDGAHLGTLGRRGQGPGEFRNLWGIFAGPGDTIWAYDSGSRQVSSFFGGEHQRNLPIYRERPVGWVGRQLVATVTTPLDRGPQPRTPGMHRDPWRVVAHAAVGSTADTVVRGLSEEMFLSDNLIWGRPILSQEPYVALGSDFVVYGDGASTELLVLKLTGDTLVTIPVAEIVGTAREELTAAATAARLESYPPERLARGRAVVRTIPLPDRVADISALAVDSEDRIWVRRLFKPKESVARWDVFDRGGGVVAWIKIPVRLTVREIGGEALLATDRDALDVSRVLVYGIGKGGEEDPPSH